MYVLASCGDADQHEETGMNVFPIEFATQLDTRAALDSYVSTAEFPYGSTIGVYGYYTETTAFTNTTEKANFMYNQPVTRELISKQLRWEYDPVKYWPNNDQEKVTFWGYYPYNGTGIALKDPTTFTGLPHFIFHVQRESRHEVDFMMSDVRADEMHINGSYITPISYRVPLVFHHALTKIIIRVVDEEGPPLPYTAFLTDLYDEGEGYYSPSVNWTNLTKTTSPVVFTTENSTTDDERIFLMLPQDLTDNDPILNIHYDYHGGFSQTEDIHLNTLEVTEWLPGKTYTYTYHVSHAGNQLSVGVNPWYQSGMVFDTDTP